MDISFRPGVPADVRYLKNTWLHAFRDGEGVRDIPNGIYWDYEDKVLQVIIPRCSNAKGVLVAYPTQPPDTDWHTIVEAPILGYIVCEPMVDALLVHMTYVRGHQKKGKKTGQQCRRQGIGSALLAEAQRKFHLEGAPIRYTYRTDMCWREYGFRQKLKELGATYVFYPKFSLLPGGCAQCQTPSWETGAVQ